MKVRKVVFPPYVAPRNGLNCHSADAGRGVSVMSAAAARHAHLNYFTTSPRKTRANGDTVMSPALSEAGFARPSLFASRISVMLRVGSVISSDEDAFASTPNCQTTGSPLYDWTNQPIAWGSGWPFALAGFCQASAR